ncbi:MAG: hypothetical protein Q7S87_05205 [Agitococcus sp.]|nr:hypothetical protein [Agitococcus sp.]
MQKRTYQGKTYAEWVLSLKEGDLVRIRHPWDDATVKGGVIVDGVVCDSWGTAGASLKVNSIYKGSEEVVVFGKSGQGSYRRLEHPERLAIYNPDNREGQCLEFALEHELGTAAIYEKTRIGGAVLKGKPRQRATGALWT